MQPVSSELYWSKKTKISNIYPYLTEDLICDVLVIGGGLNGAITSYFLAKEGIKVIVVEKNIIGYGSTLATNAILDYSSDIDMIKLEKIIGIENTKKIYQLYLNAIDKIEEIDKDIGKNTGFKRVDSIYYTNKLMQKSMLSKEFYKRKKEGYNSYFIDSHSFLNLNSAILTKNSSAVINPYLFTQKVFEKITKEYDVKLFENTKINDIKSDINEVTAVTNNKFKIKSKSAIFCSGYKTLKHFNRAPVEMLKNFSIVSTPIKELKNFDLSFIARDNLELFHSLRFDTNGRIIFSGEQIKVTDKLYNDKYFKSIANEKYRKLKNVLKKTLYNIGDIPIEYAYSSNYGITKDSLPIIDEIPGMSHCFCNLSFGGNGVLQSVIGADILKNAIKGLYTKDVNLFRVDR